MAKRLDATRLEHFVIRLGGVMEVYEVLCDGVTEARCFRCTSIDAAMKEAERVCRTFKVDVRVVRVVGTFIPDSRWISNGVPGYA